MCKVVTFSIIGAVPIIVSPSPWLINDAGSGRETKCCCVEAGEISYSCLCRGKIGIKMWRH